MTTYRTLASLLFWLFVAVGVAYGMGTYLFVHATAGAGWHAGDTAVAAGGMSLLVLSAIGALRALRGELRPAQRVLGLPPWDYAFSAVFATTLTVGLQALLA